MPLWLLALITLSGTLAMHIFVPALPTAAKDLDASSSSMQATISLYIFGLAAGQLVYGPVADRIGRRPTLLAGLMLYAFSGLAIVFAPDEFTLIALRLFQALGGCAGIVLGRAVVRDIAGPADAARQIATMNLMVMLGPGIAPVLGGAIASTLGWRPIFILLSALGFFLMALAWKLLPETAPPGANSDLATLGRNYRSLLSSRAFVGLAIGGGCATTSMYAFLASAPFIFAEQFHRPTWEAGVYIAVLMVGAWVGSAFASRTLRTQAVERVLIGWNLVSIAAALVYLAPIVTGHPSLVISVAAMTVFSVGAAASSPAAMSLAVGINPKVIGSAAGLYGFTQMAVGAIATSASGIGTDRELTTGLVLIGAGVISQACFWMSLHLIAGAKT